MSTKTEATANTKLARRIRDHHDQILTQWKENIKEDERIKKNEGHEDRIKKESQEFLTTLIETLETAETRNVEDPVFARITENAQNLAIQWERKKIPPFETALFLLNLKEIILPYLSKQGAQQDEYLFLSKLIETVSIRALQNLIEKREQVISRQEKDMVELSTPVIQVWNGMVVAPLIGSLDSDRTQKLKEVLLNRIVETESKIALLDITGVPAIDTQTAQHLIETISAVRLLGSEVVLTGVSPSIAQTLVRLGISMPDIPTRSALSEGMKIGLEKMNLKVTAKEDRKQGIQADAVNSSNHNHNRE